MSLLNEEHAKLQVEYAKVKCALEELIPAHEKLQLEHQKVIAENVKLKAGTNPPGALSPEALRILQLLFDTDGAAFGSDIAQRTGLSGGLLDHHIDVLRMRKFITQTTLRPQTASNKFQITGLGRDWIVTGANR